MKAPLAIITGGNKGLGFFQAKRFISKGYGVYVVARSKGDFDQLGKNAHFVERDLTKDKEASYIDEIFAQEGRVDALVNNAGVHLKKPIWEVSDDELDHVLDVNIRAIFAACGRYVDLHRKTGGAIVNISSMGGVMALPRAAAYVTAKTAIIGLTRSVAVDAARFGIRANAVSPGFIDTDMTRAILAKDPERRKRIEARIPTHRFGSPEDIANAVFFLASREAAYINGINLPVDGGFLVGF